MIDFERFKHSIWLKKEQAKNCMSVETQKYHAGVIQGLDIAMMIADEQQQKPSGSKFAILSSEDENACRDSADEETETDEVKHDKAVSKRL